jgi:hypothetical protein
VACEKEKEKGVTISAGTDAARVAFHMTESAPDIGGNPRRRAGKS